MNAVLRRYSPFGDTKYSDSFHIQRPFSLLIIILFLCIVSYHTRRTAPAYRAKFRKRTSLPLQIHIMAGSFEILRYHILTTLGQATPDVFDLVACLLQSYTNLVLAKTLIRGEKTTRPSYQVAGFLRPIIGVVAFVSGSPDYHCASVKLVNAFIFTRMIIFVARALRLGKIHSQPTIYAYAVFLGGVLSVYESGLSGGVPAYIGLVAMLTALNQYVSEYLKNR